jgi:histo-blood group ABO system transferase
MISILIPVYNTSSSWLWDCFMSINRQTFKDYEVVVINDGSNSQETLYVLNTFKSNSKYRIIDLPKNVGIAKALNIGLKECKYEYIARMDSDDIMLPKRLEVQIRYMVDYNVDLCCVDMHYLKLENCRWIQFDSDTKHPLIITKEFAKNNEWFINHPGVMYKKSSVLSVGGYNEELFGYAEDFELWIKMLKANMKLHNIHEKLITFRISDSSLSKKFKSDNTEYIKKLQDELIINDNQEIKKINEVSNIIFNENVIEKKEEIKMLKIGILVIATNKYTVFVDPLVKSINKYFLPEYNKYVFLFTDKIYENYEEKNIIKIYQEHMVWPEPTLRRYEIFIKNKQYFKDIDVLYYIDADMLIKNYIGEEILPDIDKKLIAIIHPGNTVTNMGTSYETNINSTAYVLDINNIYHCGGVQGGEKNAYLNVCEILMNNINTDRQKGIIAVYHDESHWNSYLIKNKNLYKELDSDYCYPEGWENLDTKKIIALDKDHKKMRE